MKSEQGPQAYLISAIKSPIILVRSSRPSFWDSCVSIVNNLENSYRKAFGERVQLLDYNDDVDDSTLLKQVQALHDQQISEIIVIDHCPSLSRLFNAIHNVWKDELPNVTIHTFGSFTYRFDEYYTFEHVLKKMPLKIVSPSTRAMNFITHHFEPSPSVFYKIPFPISTNEFRFVDNLFEEARKHFKIKDDNKVITYAGRIAEGKNLDVLINSVSETLKANKQALLIIAGDFDDSMTPGFGVVRRGTAEESFSQILFELDPAIRNRVRYLGKVSKADLKLLYHATDVFLSLSTYPLEDFGMAPMEALASGCPAILTNWGGYTDFQNAGDCELIDVSLSESGHTIDAGRVTSLLNQFLNIKETAERRRIRSEKYSQRFSVESIADEIKLIQDKPYSRMNGFSSYARTYVWINRGEILTQVKDTFYHSLYRSYFE